ncbi:hypothetical protein JDN40_09500 [Rhodomicrobium vannielii ATCC 17100]|uniref:hypothetical protein n=1 Tax=Rhodomicrobium vannielii TaxID=1069 RepID=UPI0019194836|nr:hypothetical protein [Rhodomicrobium vannielii]MBJ7534337.1 hypothetical protein [Rhodomicrobium vannielii ATCC 17100]
MSEADLARTYDVTDKMLKQEIRRATGKNIKDGLLKENGLMTVRRMLVRVAEDTETVGEAVPVLMEHIENARKGRYLYSWALVAKPLAAQLKMAA